MKDRNSGMKKGAGKVVFVCGVISLVLSAAFLVMGLVGVDAFQEDGGVFRNIIRIAIGVWLVCYGRSLMRSSD